jgi:hypothetical protein
MKTNKESEDLIIAFYAPEIIPSFLSKKFLKDSTVIPKDWDFLKPPDIGERDSLATFTNGLNIAAEEGAILFSENLINKSTTETVVPSVAEKWATIWKRFQYYGMAIKPHAFYTFEASNREKPHYVISNLLRSNSFQGFSREAIRSSISLIMTSPRGNFIITVEDMLLKQKDGLLKNGIIIKGDFQYDVASNSESVRRDSMIKYIKSWKEDWDLFNKILDQEFSDLK